MVGHVVPARTELDATARSWGDRNLADYLRHCAESTDTGAVSEREGVLVFAGAHHYPGGFTNGMIRTDVTTPVDVGLDRAEAFFRERGHGFAVWVRAHADAELVLELEHRGYRLRPPAGGLHGLFYDQPPPTPPRLELGGGVVVREVVDDAGYEDYQSVIAEAWQLGDAPRELVEGVLFPIASLRTAAMRVFVAYRGERALAASAVYVARGCAGMQWTGIRAEARGLGLGQATFLPTWQSAFDMGASMIVGQASAIGTPVWMRYGWREVTRYGRYLSPPSLTRPVRRA